MKPSVQYLTAQALSPEQVQAYHTNGYIVLRGQFSCAEAAQWQEECERLWYTPGLIDTYNVRVESRGRLTGGSVADRLDPVLDLSPRLEALARDERILVPLQSLLGDVAHLFRCKLIRKAPGTLGYSMHQDYPYWEWLGVPPDDMLTVCVAIDPADRQSGAIEVFPGLHQGRLPAPPHEPKDVDESRMDTSHGEIPELNAGDLLIFHSLTPHRSGPNRSAGTRLVLLPSYCAGRHGALYEPYNAWFRTYKLEAARRRLSSDQPASPFFR
jgi:ectoine hydroxylase-related dioxygenase (phytanoyl-CoA dioxygenase family)